MTTTAADYRARALAGVTAARESLELARLAGTADDVARAAAHLVSALDYLAGVSRR